MDPTSDITMKYPVNMGAPSLSSPFPPARHSTFPTQLSPILTPVVAASTPKKRKNSIKGAVGAIKRSLSTPIVKRSTTTAESAAMSANDKRRSKLGYHRTSVACVHCRRRKIRCLLAPDDPQNRCSNCIRLKRECNFFAVDQQPPVERRPRTGSKTDGKSGETSASSSSSPRPAGEFDQMHRMNHYHAVHDGFNDMPGQNMQFRNAPIMLPPASAVQMNTPNFDSPPSHDASHWDSRFFNPGHLSGHPRQPDEEHQNGYWKPETPITPIFSPYTPNPSTMTSMQPQPINEPVTSSYYESQSDGWSYLPTRSMSYPHASHVEDVTSHYQRPQVQTSNYHPYPVASARRASELHPPSLQTSTNSSNTSVSEAFVGAISGPIATQPIHSFTIPSNWQGVPGHSNSPLSKQAEFGGWYSEPPQLEKVQEEDAPRFAEDHTTAYRVGH